LTGEIFPEIVMLDRVAKSPVRDLTLPGKGKAWFSLSSIDFRKSMGGVRLGKASEAI